MNANDPSSSSSGSLSERFPQRALRWELRTERLQFSNRPLLMGIINVTPDSFSDGGSFFDPARAVDQALQLVDDGADLLDIGGESTRPYAEIVDEQEELRRIRPVVEAVCRRTRVPVSIDTTKARVAEVALDAGAQIINDVSGLESDRRMPDVAKSYEAGICAMHMQGTPQTMQDAPHYDDVVVEIGDYLKRRGEQLEQLGISPTKLCLDPGIGFGKTHDHNFALLKRCGEYHVLGRPLLVGHSRKGFMAKLLGDKEADRTAATIGTSLALAMSGIQILRVHDVRPIREALMLFEACGGI